MTCFIDETGQQAFPRGFEETYGFSEGYAAVRMHGKWFFIDRAGIDMTAQRFDAVTSFSAGVAIVREGAAWFVIDQSGRKLNADPFDLIWVNAHGRICAKVRGVTGVFDAASGSLR